jgi:hypothetical protein
MLNGGGFSMEDIFGSFAVINSFTSSTAPGVAFSEAAFVEKR